MTSRRDTPDGSTRQEMVDLRPVKRRFCELFPAGHPLREAILREPDVMPRWEYAAKAQVYMSIAFAMRDAARRARQ